MRDYHRQALQADRGGRYNYAELVEKIRVAQDTFIPKKALRSNNSQPKWFTNKIKHLLGTKNGLYKKLKRGEVLVRDRLSSVKRELKKEIRKAKREYEMKIAREAKTNPKGFFSAT